MLDISKRKHNSEALLILRSPRGGRLSCDRGRTTCFSYIVLMDDIKRLREA